MDKPPQCSGSVQFNLKIGCRKHKVVAIVNPNVGKNIRMPGYIHADRTLEASGLRLADRQPGDNATGIEIILGADYLPRLLKRTRNIKSVNLFSTPGGYVVWGGLPYWSREGTEPPEVESLSLTLNRISVTDPVGLEALVENLWKLDAVGISNEPFSHLEAQAVDLFKCTTRYTNRRYTVQLPFKSNSRPEINFGRAFAQLMPLKKYKDPQLFIKYQAILDEYIKEGFIKPVELEPHNDGQMHYLPHHPVLKSSTSTPMRIVFNASPKSGPNSRSLNESFYTGPNLASKIQSIILQFREKPFGLTADISKALLRIEITQKHRDYCQFLFFKDSSMTEVVAYCFKVVLFGATSSPYLLNQTIQHHLDAQTSSLASQLKTSFYVDNFQRCYNLPTDILSESQSIEKIMLEANMPLAKWTTNAPISGDFTKMGPQDYLGLD
ncbi:uncharacterized protein [Palaemon carinicauda]|uniref:uncharacterized protein n=1 Tax=Palaemon carinicauda TaxID=392227 RepID=UPI0035B60B9F